MTGIERVKGLVLVQLFDGKKRLIHQEKSPNIVTDTGDEVYSKLSAGSSLVNPPSMMMLGSFSGTPAKNGTSANLTGRYGLSGGQPQADNGIRAFDNTFPTFASKGAGLGWRVTYRCTWGPTYNATNNSLFLGCNAIILCNILPVPSNTGSTAPTNSQVLALDTFTTVDKSIQDTLIITWFQDFLGST